MNKDYRQFILASAVLLTISAPNVLAADASATAVNDARQEAQIWTTYALNPYLRANNLKVVVLNGKAVLTGKVDEKVNKELAKAIALGVSGITDVDNQIEITPDYRPTLPGGSYGERMDDANITAAVKSKLLWSKSTDGSNMDVSTKMGIVSLTGPADSQADKEAAGRLALNTRGVASIKNELMVRGKPLSAEERAKHEKAEYAAESHTFSDSWITTKVKSTYLYSSNVAGTDIDVSTNAGVVTLTGKVMSGAERLLAIELAQNIRGVKSVSSKALTF
ncbi:MAG: BON domain-containing protein [Gammaproteobacteria bacterium]|jgi:hyperosmotically inducible periplasmic protein|nr:BON domain-containing protein [Gammaproteobacteria bacterium]MBU2178132.1 BON domain-containing protein [Gammaproteobacteria bacterium]MBU2225058.1 BON domain-containing protein [Gammaproteobacteria bacterium]